MCLARVITGVGTGILNGAFNLPPPHFCSHPLPRPRRRPPISSASTCSVYGPAKVPADLEDMAELFGGSVIVCRAQQELEVVKLQEGQIP